MQPGSDAGPWARLRRIAAATPRSVPPAVQEWCEFCHQPVPADHRHLVDIQKRAILCACRACSLLFDRRAAGGAHYRLVPERSRYVEDFELDERRWAGLNIPVDMAFFFFSSGAGRLVAYYPSPAGPTESLLDLRAWSELEAANPVLAEMEPDVEALLVNRARGAPSHWLTPIDVCFRLVGLIRTRWKGLSGGEDVWSDVGRFFEDLGGRSQRVGRNGSGAERS